MEICTCFLGVFTYRFTVAMSCLFLRKKYFSVPIFNLLASVLESRRVKYPFLHPSLQLEETTLSQTRQ